MEEENTIYSFKVLIMGEPSVGKTSLVRRIIDGTYKADYKSTIGVAFHIKNIQWGDNTLVTLHIWDVAGQQRCSEQMPLFFRDARGGLIIYDVNNEDTLGHTDEWLQCVRENCNSSLLKSNYDLPLVLLGNKKDLLSEDTLNQEKQLNARVSEHKYIGGYLCSVKENTGFSDALSRLITEMIAEEAKFKGKYKDVDILRVGIDRVQNDGCGC